MWLCGLKCLESNMWYDMFKDRLKKEKALICLDDGPS